MCKGAPVRGSPPRTTRIGDPLAWAGALLVCALGVALLVFLARMLGVASPLFAFQFHFVGMAAAVYIDKLLAPRLDGPRFDVSPREVRVYRALGAIRFMGLLRSIGWEAALRAGQKFELKRATLREYERATRQGENAHAILFLLTIVVALVLTMAQQAAAAPWLLGMGVLFHVFPVMLQRTQRARLQPLLVRRPAGQ